MCCDVWNEEVLQAIFDQTNAITGLGRGTLRNNQLHKPRRCPTTAAKLIHSTVEKIILNQTRLVLLAPPRWTGRAASAPSDTHGKPPARPPKLFSRSRFFFKIQFF